MKSPRARFAGWAIALVVCASGFGCQRSGTPSGSASVEAAEASGLSEGARGGSDAGLAQAREASRSWRGESGASSEASGFWYSPATEAVGEVSLFSNRLALTAIDLEVPAGPVKMQLARQLQNDSPAAGLLGSRWRSNWESRLLRTESVAIIDEGQGPITFASELGSATYRRGSGDEIVFQQDRAVRTRPDGVTEVFDAQGRLVESDLSNSNRIILQYDAEGRLSRLQGPRASFLQFTTDEQGRLLRAESSDGAVVRYTYEGAELVAVQLGKDPPLRYSYDLQGRLTRISHPRISDVELTYDAQGRVLSRRWGDRGHELFEYNDDTNTIRHVNSAGRQTTTRWSEDRRRQETTDPLGRTSVTEFDADGRPVVITDAAGHETRLTYDELGRVASVQNAAGQTTRFEYLAQTSYLSSILLPGELPRTHHYDDRMNLEEIRVGAQALLQMAYYPDGLVKSLKQWGGPETRYTYDAMARRATASGPDGQQIRFEYDSRGNLIRLSDASGRATVWSYDGAGRVISETDPAGAVVRYEYDADGRVASVTDAAGDTTRSQYDPQGRLLSVAAPGPAVTRYEYDSQGNLTRMVFPDGQTETYQHNDAGDLITIDHSSGARWTLSYDAAGRIVQVTGPLGYKAEFQYDAAGRQVSATDALGRTTEYTYDALGQLASVRDPGGRTLRMDRDSAGRVIAQVDPLGRRVRIDYDEYGQAIAVAREGERLLNFRYDQGRLAELAGPAGGAARYSYDAAGRRDGLRYANGESLRFALNGDGQISKAVDGVGRAWRAEYTPLGQLAGMTSPSGARYRYHYTPLGQLGRWVDANGNARTFQYDAWGRRVSETDALGRSTAISYGSGTEARAVTQADGSTTRMTYDLLGRLVEVQYADGPPARFRYDVVGNLLEEEQGDYRAAYRYDELDRLVEAAYHPAKRTVRYHYDEAGRRSALEVEGIGSWSYRYDARDRLVELEDPKGRTARFEYDEAARITRQILPNGVIVNRRYDARGRITALSANSPDGEPLVDRHYRYDLAGNLMEETREDGAQLSYGYDDEGRLAAVTGGGSDEQFIYDAAGNRLLPGGASEYDAADQLLHFAGERFGHDALGRIVLRQKGDETLEYAYDPAGRLSEVKRDGETQVEYAYDPQGRRIWKKSGRETVHYVYDGLQTLLELDDVGEVSRLWTQGPQRDRPISFDENGKTHYLIADLVDSMIALAGEDGTLTGRWSYSPFGQWQGGGEKGVSPVGYAGREYDPETGLYYFRARYYDPRLGRFITPDPVAGRLGDPASLHAYQFALNNPLRYADPLGTFVASDMADAIERNSSSVGAWTGDALGRAGLNLVTAPVRAANWFRGEEGRRSNERLDRGIDWAANETAFVGDGFASTAAAVVSDPLRFGQASGDLAGEYDAGREVSGWQWASTGLTEFGRGASLATGTGNLVRGGTRAATGGMERFGRMMEGNYGRAYAHTSSGAPITPTQLFNARPGVGGFVSNTGPQAGRVFVSPQSKLLGQEAELFAHEGFHSLLRNTPGFGQFKTHLAGLRNSANPAAQAVAKVWQFGEESVAYVLQAGHSLTRELASRAPESLSGIFRHIGRVYTWKGQPVPDWARNLNALVRGGEGIAQRLHELGSRIPWQSVVGAEGWAILNEQLGLDGVSSNRHSFQDPQHLANLERLVAALRSEVDAIAGEPKRIGQALSEARSLSTEATGAVNAADSLLTTLRETVARIESASSDCQTAAAIRAEVEADAQGAEKTEELVRQALDATDAAAQSIQSSEQQARLLQAYAAAESLVGKISASLTHARERSAALKNILTDADRARRETGQRAQLLAQIRTRTGEALDRAGLARSKIDAARAGLATLKTREAQLMQKISAARGIFNSVEGSDAKFADLTSQLKAAAVPGADPDAVLADAQPAETRARAIEAEAAALASKEYALCEGITPADAEVDRADTASTLAILRLAQSEDLRQKVAAWSPAKKPQDPLADAASQPGEPKDKPGSDPAGLLGQLAGDVKPADAASDSDEDSRRAGSPVASPSLGDLAKDLTRVEAATPDDQSSASEAPPLGRLAGDLSRRKPARSRQPQASSGASLTKTPARTSTRPVAPKTAPTRVPTHQPFYAVFETWWVNKENKYVSQRPVYRAFYISGDALPFFAAQAAGQGRAGGWFNAKGRYHVTFSYEGTYTDKARVEQFHLSGAGLGVYVDAVATEAELRRRYPQIFAGEDAPIAGTGVLAVSASDGSWTATVSDTRWRGTVRGTAIRPGWSGAAKAACAEFINRVWSIMKGPIELGPPPKGPRA